MSAADDIQIALAPSTIWMVLDFALLFSASPLKEKQLVNFFLPLPCDSYASFEKHAPNQPIHLLSSLFPSLHELTFLVGKL